MTELYKSLFFILLFFVSKILFSQSLIGTQSSYAGSNSMSMNPASMTTSDVYFDFSLVNLGLSFYNNYAYRGEGIQDIDKQFFMYPYAGLRIEFTLTTRELCQRYRL